jgi:mono/diheme cytochrome c family protein
MKIRRIGVVFALFAASLTHGAQDGKALYVAKCAMCHGNDGTAGQLGTGSRNFNDRAFKSAVTEAHIVTIIHDGQGKMKGLGDKMTPDQAREVAAYVLSLAK